MPDNEYHRYGRHGPHAWLRRRNHRWRNSLPITPSETRVVVIYVHVPVVLTERMVIVVNPTEQPKEVEGSVEAAIELDGFENIRENMRDFGVQHGEEQADLDTHSLVRNILIGDELQEKAGIDFKKRLSPANIGTFSREEARILYEKAYCAAYRSIVAPIEDELTRAVWVLAIQNRKSAKQQEAMLGVSNEEEPWRSEHSNDLSGCRHFVRRSDSTDRRGPVNSPGSHNSPLIMFHVTKAKLTRQS